MFNLCDVHLHGRCMCSKVDLFRFYVFGDMITMENNYISCGGKEATVPQFFIGKRALPLKIENSTFGSEYWDTFYDIQYDDILH